MKPASVWKMYPNRGKEDALLHHHHVPGELHLPAKFSLKNFISRMSPSHRRPRDVEEGARPATKIMLRAGGFIFLLSSLALSVGLPIYQTVQDAIGRNPAIGREGDFFGNMKRALSPSTDGGLMDLLNSLKFSGLAAILMVLLALIIGHYAVRKGPRRESLFFVLAFADRPYYKTMLWLTSLCNDALKPSPLSVITNAP